MGIFFDFTSYLNTFSTEVLWFIFLFFCFSSILIFLKIFGYIGLYIYSGIAVIAANIQVLKIVDFFYSPAPVALGTVLFASTFLCTDILSEYFDRYKARGFIKSVNEHQEQIIIEDNEPIKRVSDTRTMLNQASQKALDNIENAPVKQRTEREAKLNRLAKSKTAKNRQIKKARTEHEIELQRTQGSSNKIKFIQNSTQKIMKNAKISPT